METIETLREKLRAETARRNSKQLLVWWLTEEDYHGFEPGGGKNPLKLADYIWLEFCSRSGRNGRARLWVPAEIKVEKLDLPDNTPRLEKYMDAGGIVIYAKDAAACALWGGRFTDLSLNPVEIQTE